MKYARRRRKHKLSILYLRCDHVDKCCAALRAHIAFNSLFEMRIHASAHSLGTYFSAFNYLSGMRGGW